MGMIGGLYLIEILHQTTTITIRFTTSCSCILLKFYIKPQLWEGQNKNKKGCILLKFYIKPQRMLDLMKGAKSCILLKFYIKPQLWNRRLKN